MCLCTFSLAENIPYQVIKKKDTETHTRPGLYGLVQKEWRDSMNLQGGEQTPDLPQEMKRSFTASGWRKYQMRQRQRISDGHISAEAEAEVEEAS